MIECVSVSRSGKHGVGRIDIVENRFIGMKSRGEQLKNYAFLFECSYFGCGLFLSAPLQSIKGSLAGTNSAEWEEMDIFALKSQYFNLTSIQNASLSASRGFHVICRYFT